MWFKFLRPSILRAEPQADAEQIGEAFAEEVGRKTGEKDGWIELKVRSGGGVAVRGWVKSQADRIQETSEPPRPELNLWGFLKHSVNAELWVNGKPETAPHFIAADYLIALAKIESGLKNAGELVSGSGCVGPFQFTEKRWQEFLEASDDDMFDADDREDALDQIFGAAFLAQRDVKAISDAVGAFDTEHNDGETSGDTGPFLPSLVDVFLAHMVGVPSTVKFRAAKFADKGELPVTDVLKEAFPDEAELAGLLTHRRHFLKIDAERPETTDGMYAKIEARLDAELKHAYKLMEANTPEDLPVVAGGAPWMAFARQEEQAWKDETVSEASQSGRDRIKTYFKSSGLETNEVLPWCGAFAAFSMEKAGQPIPKESARAANWKQWGNVGIPIGSKDIPEGAVIVLAPAPGTSRSGHVSFYTRHLTGQAQVELLGGNQRNRVKLGKFPRTKIVAIRWQSDAAIVAEASGTAADFATLLNFIGKVESNNNYNAYFRHAGNTDSPRLTGLTIRKVRAFQDDLVARGSRSSAAGKYQIIRKTLDGICRNLNLSGNELFDEAMQDLMAIRLLRERGLDKFKAGRIGPETFANNIAMEWASMPVTTGPKAGHSFYDGDGLNKCLVSVADFLAAVKAIA
ncbi:MAG: hypothetical protein M3Y78_11730 [Pseudomonadota bacterium]|nr:hypothetical protein [Pseudomonadota bacterium]